MSEQWSEWIEHKLGDPCPIPWAMPMEWEYQRGGDKKFIATGAIDLYETEWGGSQPSFKITRYRYRLDRAPAGFVPPGAEKPWVPPVPEGFGPWVETGGADPELPGGSIVHILCPFERIERTFLARKRDADGVYWRGVTAYCLKLEDQPTQEQVEATQQPWSLEQDAADWAADSDLQNRPMFDADDVGVSAGKWDRFNARLAAPTAAPGFMVRAVRSSDGLLTVREADHRLGLWS